MATTKPNVMVLNEPDASNSAEVLDTSASLDDGTLQTKVADALKNESDKAELTEADKIVSGGHGIKGP